MKKEGVVLLLLGILLVSPLVLAQEQTQTYSGFSRFVDNVKLFFSSGDNKVDLAVDSDVKITGEVITSEGKESPLGKFFKRIFGK